jgi:hypothetical protein
VSAPVSPLLVIQNNLPDYRAELLEEIGKLQHRLFNLQEELETLDALVATLDTMNRKHAATPTYETGL